jgi:hypothetical protein
MNSPINPDLQAALQSSAGPLNVFAKLKASPGVIPAKQAEEIVQRVARLMKQSPGYHFRDLDSVLHLCAGSGFIKTFLSQPEVASVSLVPDHGSALIDPISRRDVDETEIAEPTYPRRHVPHRDR